MSCVIFTDVEDLLFKRSFCFSRGSSSCTRVALDARDTGSTCARGAEPEGHTHVHVLLRAYEPSCQPVYCHVIACPLSGEAQCSNITRPRPPTRDDATQDDSAAAKYLAY